MNDELYGDALLIFFEEAREMLQQIEDCLLCLQQDPDNTEAVHTLFRAAHTIKGSSGVFSLERVVCFTHLLESVLDQVRKRALHIDPALGELLLASRDMIGALLQQSEQHCADVATLAETDARAAVLAARLTRYLNGDVAVTQPASNIAAATPQAASWHLSLRFRCDTYRNGFDPLTVIAYLKTLGQFDTIVTVEDGLPAWEALDPESCHLGFEICLLTSASKSDIEAAFEFVAEDCDIRLIPPTRRVADFIALINDLPQELRLGDILVSCGALTRDALDAALARQKKETLNDTPLGEILVARHQIPVEVVDAALERQERGPTQRQDGGLFVRVPADKLDDLINLVGELVICGASASLQAVQAGHTSLVGTTHQLSRLIEEIRDGTLGLRMVRIGETFVRYRRVVHDVARELDKEVRLEIDGAETELDKSVVEKIGDPLMHLVRNALDHGIEPPQSRLTAGKPAQGRIGLTARHDAGNIVIEVSDDGRGLDGEKLLAKARDRGLVGATQQLSEREKLELIFAPGFSTAEQVTNLSGRGVGMDVVRKNIEALRGTVTLHSVPGKGTTVEIQLPLTLAIIDGFLVRIGDGSFVIPLHAVVECIDAVDDGAAVGRQAAGFINLRNGVLPLLDLRTIFSVPGPAPAKRRIVVVQGGGSAGLIVDHLDGEYQTVIKPLGKLFRNLRGISGSTVLGSGDVALILDVATLVKMAAQGTPRDSGAALAIPG
ncbi:chemotaxis protein CheA [Janthinobacterium lividum]|uniref:chemotaxis protein CheA n=1 Tax=Janthinobacterium sp. LB2P10 TaxID=3424194 RepID=UPI00028834B2